MIRNQGSATRFVALLPAIFLGIAGCASGGSEINSTTGTAWGAATPEMAVRNFMDAANSEDFATMSNLFGTAEGPAVEEYGVADVEARMIFLSRLLKHEAFALNQANLAMLGPDRIRYEVRMTGTRKGDVTVPTVVVPDASGRWFVERLNVDALAAGL
ncbi:MAG: hypothetical protein P8049_06805 [Gemmatimonadota bacterium]